MIPNRKKTQKMLGPTHNSMNKFNIEKLLLRESSRFDFLPTPALSFTTVLEISGPSLPSNTPGQMRGASRPVFLGCKRQ